MSDNGSLPARVRRDRMLALARDGDFVHVKQLAMQFDVSEVTVRGDLDALEERGLLRRVRGGAVPRTPTQAELGFEQSEVAAEEQKRAIAREVVTMIEPGSTVILDVGSTTTAIAREIAARQDLTDVTVFTNSLTIAFALEAAAPPTSPSW